MNQEYQIHCFSDDIDQVANIAFSGGKNTCGLIFSQDNVHKIYGWGKHSDAVRVYSALKANGLEIITTIGV